jgi:ubiquinone/menaquinone biosynthesis C-methylase UbiE
MAEQPQTFDIEFLLGLDNEDQLYNLVSDQFHDWTHGFYGAANRELLNHLHLTPNIRVMELACGTGHLAIEMARRVAPGRVLGVDLSPQMIAKGREGAAAAGLKNLEFLERNIHHVLPEFKPGDFDVGVSCFALSYLGCDFLLKEMRDILGDRGQVGITTSSLNSLSEWQPLFLEFLGGGGMPLPSASAMSDVPQNSEDLAQRLAKAGFERVRVESLSVPLKFNNAKEAASFLISAGWLSNYFFLLEDKAVRRQILEWACARVDEHHRNDPHLSTSIEFLVAWNEPKP